MTGGAVIVLDKARCIYSILSNCLVCLYFGNQLNSLEQLSDSHLSLAMLTFDFNV